MTADRSQGCFISILNQLVWVLGVDQILRLCLKRSSNIFYFAWFPASKSCCAFWCFSVFAWAYSRRSSITQTPKPSASMAVLLPCLSIKDLSLKTSWCTWWDLALVHRELLKKVLIRVLDSPKLVLVPPQFCLTKLMRRITPSFQRSKKVNLLNGLKFSW